MNTVSGDKVASIAEIKRFERIGAHTHIKGLGLDGLKAVPIKDGMVGQCKAREAAGVVVKMIKIGKMAGRAILLAGPPGTGKTAIAVAIARELGKDVPFVSISGSEIYSSEMKKTEVLMQAMRKAIGVRIREMRRVYEGEVTNFEVSMTKHPYNPYQSIPERAKLTLSTTSQTKTFSIGQSIAMSLINQGIRIGDVIQIDAETGRVTRLGRSSQASSEYDIEAKQDIVPRPSGPIEKEKEFVYVMTLHDLDTLQARSSGGIFSLLFGGAEKAEIDSEVRQRVDEQVKSLVEEGRAEIIPGVIFIDEVHMLDIEAFAFLNRTMESELSPIIILASNRGITRVRGTDIEAPHGIPLDLLDRLLIINTEIYSPEEIKEIIKIRASEEKVKISEEALNLLTKIGSESSLRYAVQLLTPAYETAKEKGRDKIEVDDIEHVKKLFSDISHSIQFLKRYEERMLL